MVTPKIGDTVSFDSSANVSTAVVVDILVDQKYPEYGNWIWVVYKENGRKKKCRLPENNLAAYNFKIISSN